MNELLAFSVLSFLWGFILWECGSFIEDVLKKASRIGFFFKIIGVIFMSVPFVIAAIGASAFIITGFAEAISVLI